MSDQRLRSLRSMAEARPDDAIMMDTLGAWIGDEAIIKHILVDNPAQLYGF